MLCCECEWSLWVSAFFFFPPLSLSFLPPAALTLYLPSDSHFLLPFFQLIPAVSALNAIDSTLWLFVQLSSSTLFQLLKSISYLSPFCSLKRKEGERGSWDPSLGSTRFDLILLAEGEDSGSSLRTDVGHENVQAAYTCIHTLLGNNPAQQHFTGLGVFLNLLIPGDI